MQNEVYVTLAARSSSYWVHELAGQASSTTSWEVCRCKRATRCPHSHLWTIKPQLKLLWVAQQALVQSLMVSISKQWLSLFPSFSLFLSLFHDCSFFSSLLFCFSYLIQKMKIGKTHVSSFWINAISRWPETYVTLHYIYTYIMIRTGTFPGRLQIIKREHKGGTTNGK